MIAVSTLLSQTALRFRRFKKGNFFNKTIADEPGLVPVAKPLSQ